MITFNLVPNDIRVPGSYVEFDASKALSGMPSVPLKILVIGQRLATGAVAALTPVRITNAAEAVAAFGRGSMLAMGIAALKAVNDKTECWAIGLADDGAAVAAAGTITVTGPATAAGTIALYIGGKRLTIGVASGDTANAIAAAIEAKIDADLDLPVTAAVAGAVVTVTARNKGTAGNDIDIRHSYYQGEGLPAGTGLAIVAMAAGATNPDVGTVWPVIGDERFDFVVLPFADARDAQYRRRRNGAPFWPAGRGRRRGGCRLSRHAGQCPGAGHDAQLRVHLDRGFKIDAHAIPSPLPAPIMASSPITPRLIRRARSRR
jgi:phage tail sheath gpL-like